MKPILCFGEILVDFIANDAGKPLYESEVFVKKPGGSPFNVAVGLSRLGRKVSFLGKLGGDPFSKFLFQMLKGESIDTSFLVISKEFKTSLVFIARDRAGSPDFVFYRDHPADTSLTYEEIRLPVSRFSLFHFGSMAVVFEPLRSTSLRVMEDFVRQKIPVSFDPNVRPNIIKNRNNFIKDFFHIAENVTILKLSHQDLSYIFPGEPVDKVIHKIPLKKDSLLFVTMGEKGCLVHFENNQYVVPAFPIDVVDTTGCGDAFMAAVIFKYTEKPPTTVKEAKDIAVFANAVAALVTTRIGAASAMPTLDEVKRFLESRSTRAG